MFFQKNDFYDSFIYQKIKKEFIGESIQELEGGTENKSFLISGKIVLRVLFINHRSIVYDSAELLILREVLIVNELYNKGITSMCYNEFSNGQYYQLFNVKLGKIFFLQYNFIEGIHLQYDEMSVINVARCINNMHKAIQSMDLGNYYVKEYDDLVSCLHHRHFRFNPEVSSYVQNYRYYFNFFLENTRLLKKFKSINKNNFIHGDLHCKNLLVSSVLCFIDFGDIRNSVIEEELGIFLWGMSLEVLSNHQLEKLMNTFLDYYADKEKLVNKEFCLRYAVQRYLDIHMFYLDNNLKDDNKMKYQVNKFEIERPQIDFFIEEIHKYEQ